MSSQKKIRYGFQWDIAMPDVQVEFWMIRKGKQWLEGRGDNLFNHYKAAQKLLWPADDEHRWGDLALKRFLEHEVVIMLGCGASSKTYNMAKYALIDWWAFADKTLWLISSTEYRGADLRIWGDIQLLFNRAKAIHEHLPGKPISSLHAIAFEEMDEDQDDYFKAARSMKRGLIVVPSKKGNTIVGLSAFIGVRVPRLRHAGDEIQAMAPGFADAYSNWYGNSDFKGVMSGNPTDITDQLCMLSEPPEGWDGFIDTGKTQEWEAKFFNAHVIAFDGRDSPNFDFPDAETKPRFPYLVGPKKLKAVEETHGKNSWQYYSQCIGKPNKALLINRVITSKMCDTGNAHGEAIWEGQNIIKILACDPAYGGGDRAVTMMLEMGRDISGVQILKCNPPEIIPINLRISEEPEMQIARYLQITMASNNIPISNCGYDSFGKGTLGFYMAQVFGSNTPTPIDSGAQPTDRPVRFDLYTIDNSTRQRRLKRCNEHYTKFVSEMWFSCAEAIQSKQIRELPKTVMLEGCMRVYEPAGNNSKLEIEPKDKLKERLGKSCDLFDCFAIGVEMARRLGFRIERIGKEVEVDTPSRFEWFTERQRILNDRRRQKDLTYFA